MEQIDHISRVDDRLATQFRESTNLKAYIKSLLNESNVLEQLFIDIIESRYIDSATGVNLDVIGIIVGQPRILVDGTSLTYFGFNGHISSDSFGSLYEPSVGSRFRSLGESLTGSRTLADDEYRLFIKARIIKNSISPTIPEVTEFFKFLFDTDTIVVIDGHMNYHVQIGRLLSNNEKVFLDNTDLLPKVAAVGSGYSEFVPSSNFGFAGFPGALGFGSLNDPLEGGEFASLI